MKKIVILFFLLMTSIANAGTLGEQTKHWIENGYKIIGSGIEFKGAQRYWIMFENVNAENMVIICQKYYDQKETSCYDL